jgi:hypothetical protein
MLNWQTITVAASAGALALTGVAYAAPQSTSAKTTAVTTLSAQDEAEIRQLSTRYAHALGLCQADEYAKVFTADGFYSSSEFTGEVHRQMYGPNGARIPRSDMTRFVMSEPQCTNANAPKTPREAPANIPVRATKEGAAATIPLANGAVYQDSYVKTPDGWRIKSREHVRAGQTAFSTRTTTK